MTVGLTASVLRYSLYLINLTSGVDLRRRLRLFFYLFEPHLYKFYVRGNIWQLVEILYLRS
jgi:hypothetical protein